MVERWLFGLGKPARLVSTPACGRNAGYGGQAWPGTLLGPEGAAAAAGVLLCGPVVPAW